MNALMEELSLSMHLPLRRLFSDIKDLAWHWEIITEETNSRCGISVLHGLGHAYLRGLGYRMGNIQGIRAHGSKVAILCTEVIRHVVEEGPIIFPALHAYGFRSQEKALELMRAEIGPKHKDVLTMAEEILREKQGGGNP